MHTVMPRCHYYHALHCSCILMCVWLLSSAANMCFCMQAHIYVYMHTSACMHMYTCTHTYNLKVLEQLWNNLDAWRGLAKNMPVCVCMYSNIYKYTYFDVCVYTQCTYIHTYTRLHKHVQRLTSEAALKHPWLHDEASDKVLKVQENLRSWRARMRFKKAIIATVATTRWRAHFMTLNCMF